MIFLLWQLELTKTESQKSPSACVVLSFPGLTTWPRLCPSLSCDSESCAAYSGGSGVHSGDPANLALGPPLQVMNAQLLPKQHVPKLGRVGSC